MTASSYLVGVAAALIVAALALAAVLVTRRRPYKPGRRIDRIDREVQQALTDPAYAPYGADLEDRPVPRGPLPGVGEVDDQDYVARAQQHQPCDAHPCTHWAPRPDRKTPQHCRCGRIWPCIKAGPLNTNPDAPIPNQRNRNERRTERGDGWW